MDKRTLGATGLNVSRACLGTMTFGGQADEGMSARILDASVDRGINFIDTANVYNNGESENILGRLMGSRRNDLVLATKVGLQGGDWPAGLTRNLILRGVEASLKRLKTDYVDLLYLHVPDWSTPLDETLAAADHLVREGMARQVASSNYAAWQMCRMLWISETRGYAPAFVCQPMYNLLARRIEDELFAFCREFSVGTVVYNPLAGGLLTAKHQSASAPESGTRFDGNKTYLDRYWNDANHRAVDRLKVAADTEGRSLVSLALNWVLHHTPADCLILGASTEAQVSENLRALDDGALSAGTLRICDEVWESLRGASPRYNR